ncbi:cytochrome P450 [Pluteus cervinus]|uniref:Cytochrome P450 n=1 Tax=Pluteus cervinus TaxID=181527 RepID=A0ACD3AEK0_9AGAR|nr:cytochrome P450 [Pluteus cervinus]
MALAVLAIAILSAFFITVIRLRSNSQHAMPPGPKGLPFIGNILQIPPFPFLQFTEWKAKFGPILSLNLAGQPAIVISSLKVANDLLERRSGIYSDRPRFIVAGEVLTGGLFLPLLSYGDYWRKHRRAAHEGLRSQVVPTYQAAQELEAVTLAQNLIKSPELWYEEIQRSTASSVKTTIYGTPPISSKNDPTVAFIDEMGHRITFASQPGKYLVEFFPKLLLLPAWLAPWKREAIKWYRNDTHELENLVQPIKGQVENGTHKPSFAAYMCLAGDRHHLTHGEEAWLPGTMFMAGFDTSSAAFRFFILAMVLHPEVMKKAQSELDRVVGRERVPDFSDRDKLPYIRAMIKELLRWSPVAPLGVARRVQQDDYYEGYFIPKGTLVLWNAWAINNDPEMFPSPHEFRPERFLDPTETEEIVVPGTRNHGHASFGFGRRHCIGANLAVQFQFINIAILLWAANIEAAYDKNGQIITPSNSPEGWVDEGNVLRPTSFPCNIIPRFTGAETVLQRARDEKST